MDRDDRDIAGFAMPAENVVHRRIIDGGVDKDSRSTAADKRSGSYRILSGSG